MRFLGIREGELTPVDPRQATGRVVLEGLQACAGGLAVACVAFSVISYLRHGVLWLTVFNLATAGILTSFVFLARRGEIQPRWANAMVALTLLLATLDVLFALGLFREFNQNHFVALIVVGAGSFLLSNRWLAVTIGGIWLAWLPVAWWAIEMDNLVRFALTLFAATILALAIHTARMRSHLRLSEALGRLHKSEERYRSLFQQAKDVIVLSTPAGQLIDINPAGIDLFGFRDEDIPYLELGEHIYTDSGDRERLRQALLEKGFVTDFRSSFETKDGRQLDLESTSTAVRDSEGRITAFLTTLRDVTDRRLLQRQRENPTEHRVSVPLPSLDD